MVYFLVLSNVPDKLDAEAGYDIARRIIKDGIQDDLGC